MATVRDIMPRFELFQPESGEEAVALLARLGAKARVLAGGFDCLEWFKDRIKRPEAVVDMSRAAELAGIREVEGGLEIGAMTTLSEVARHPVVSSKFSLLSDAADAVASPQIRNQATIGGNVSQDARCWYYRNGWTCYRAGGNICYADTPEGMNREHAVFEADRCVAVNPSDTAPALVALDARMVIRNARGMREVKARDYFVGPGFDITRMTVLGTGDLLASIRIPAAWAGARFYFEKVRDRAVWDFPLVNIASAAIVSGGWIERMSLALNGVAARPLRLVRVERAVRGRAPNEATAAEAGRLAIAGAQPLRQNGWKVTVVQNLVKRAVSGRGGQWT
ncbi:MAG: FAD binding domain-containing protein [Syntrophobacteraceae bacterium]